MLPQESLNQLKTFLNVVKDAPQILHTPELAFFKEFIESYGGVIPPPASSGGSTKPPASEEQKPAAPEEEESSEESEIELDNTGVIENPDPEIKDDDVNVSPDVEVSEENIEKANEIRAQAIGQYAEGNYEKAVELFTEAIKLNPGMSLLYVKRGQCYLQLQRPNACIHECNKALSINPDNAAAYKFRGRAHRLLGHWLEAVKDLRNACRIDFDEQADEWLKEVTPNAMKIENHQRRYERKKSEREFDKNQFSSKYVDSAKKTISDGNVKSRKSGASDGPLPGGYTNYYAAGLADPEISASASVDDPELMAMLSDICKNPSKNLPKYATHPKISILNEMIRRKKAAGVWPTTPDPVLAQYVGDAEVNDALQDIYSNPLNIEKYFGNPKVMKLLSYTLGQCGFKFPGEGFPDFS